MRKVNQFSGWESYREQSIYAHYEDICDGYSMDGEHMSQDSHYLTFYREHKLMYEVIETTYQMQIHRLFELHK